MPEEHQVQATALYCLQYWTRWSARKILENKFWLPSCPGKMQYNPWLSAFSFFKDSWLNMNSRTWHSTAWFLYPKDRAWIMKWYGGTVHSFRFYREIKFVTFSMLSANHIGTSSGRIEDLRKFSSQSLALIFVIGIINTVLSQLIWFLLMWSELLI